MRGKIKKLITVLSFGVFFVLGYFGMVVNSKAATPGNALVASRTVKKDGVDLTPTTIVFDNDTLEVQYKLVNLIPQGVGKNINQGETYSIDLPSNLEFASSSVTWKADLGSLPIGDCRYDSTSKSIEITFDDDLFTNPAYASGSIPNAFIGFYATVDGSGKSVGTGYKITGPSGTTPDIDFLYGGKTPTPEATVKKTGAAYNATDHTIDWTVTVTEGTTERNSLVVKDTISDNQAFIASSFKVDGVSKTPTISGKNLSYTLDISSPFPNKEHVITYTTAAYPVESTSSGLNSKAGNPVSLDMDNTASVHLNSTSPALDTANAKVNGNFGNLQWTEKEYVGVEGTGADRTFTWQVKVNTNGYTYKNVVIKDIVDMADISGSTISYVPSSFTMLDSSNNPVAGATVSGTPTFTGGKCQWETTAIPSLNGVYTITYKVQITNYSNYKTHNTTDQPMKNTAWATYDEISIGGLPGVGPGQIPPITVDAGNVATTKSSLAKVVPVPGYSYDVSERGAEVHGCPWMITVNADREVLPSNTYLIETIGGTNPDLEQTLESFTDKDKVIFEVKVNGADATSAELSEITMTKIDDTHVRINFGTLLTSGKAVSFRFQTYLTNQAYYEGMYGDGPNDAHWHDARNTATLYVDDVPIVVDAFQGIFTKVLDKKFIGYDYKDHIITWRFEINRDMMALDGVVIDDILPLGSLDKVEVVKHATDSHDENAGAKSTLVKDVAGVDGIIYTYDESTKKVSVNFGNIPKKQTYTMYIYEKVKPTDTIVDGTDTKSLATYNGEINVKNEAVMHKAHTADNKVTTTGVIDNKLFDKSATINSVGRARYTININQGRMDWPVNAELSDVMSEGLTPDLGSFELYVADVASDGAMSKVSLVPAADYSAIVEKLSDGKTKTTIKLPASAGNNAYILEYNVYIDEEYTGKTGISFDNTITFDDIPNKGILASETITLADLMGFGGGNLEYSKAKIVKKNEAGEVLKGAEFDLIYDGAVVQSATTDEKGEIIFSNLTPGLTYTVRETKAPEGYLKAADVTFEALDRGDTTLVDKPLLIVDKKDPNYKPTPKPDPKPDPKPTPDPDPTIIPPSDPPVSPTPETSGKPKTGDSARPNEAFFLLIASAVSMYALHLKRKHRR